VKISEKLQLIRNIKGINKKEFAELIGVAQSTITRYESGDREPDYSFLKNLFDKLDVNPNWIFFDELPQINYVDELTVSNENRQLLLDLNNTFTPNELNEELNKIIISKAIDEIAGPNSSKEKSSIRKFLEAIRLEGHIPFRPLLFLYYIFRYVRDNNDELDNLKLDKAERPYQTYLLDLVRRYSVLSFKNNPAFTSQIKKQFEASISMYLEEEDCKRLITHYDQVIKNIESKMTPIIVFSHKKIDTKTLFPK
jgi:transcriptional regulator with XRE-family HTH domain